VVGGGSLDDSGLEGGERVHASGSVAHGLDTATIGCRFDNA
jgi:hypothetical protein